MTFYESINIHVFLHLIVRHGFKGVKIPPHHAFHLGSRLGRSASQKNVHPRPDIIQNLFGRNQALFPLTIGGVAHFIFFG
jgi:hypothetical protein